MSGDKALRGASVLIVEDEPAIAELLIEAVADAGALVVGPAVRVEDALETLRRDKVDAAIIDLIIHGTYCDEIAGELARRDIPFAVTTGIGVDDSHPALRGVVAITKPFQARYVQEVLAGLLGAPQCC